MRFKTLPKVRGVATPVLILGDRIGRIRYTHTQGKNRMVMDCRLAVALQRASPLFNVNGVGVVYYSNFYSWRYVKGTKRLSRHALGLAVDIHSLKALNGRRMDLTQHYEKGLGRGRTCEGRARTWKGRLLRDLTCDLDESGLFERILTPDFDQGHRDHFHISTFHPMDRKRLRIYRTVLPEVHGNMPSWAWKRPVRASYRLARIQQIVRRRRIKLARWRKTQRLTKKARSR